MVVNFANIDFKERPVLILKNAGGTPLGVLGYAQNVACDLKYNEISTIEFDIPAYADGAAVPFYGSITGMRIVELTDVGQFTMVNPNETGDGIRRLKHCKGYSLEYEFVHKKITLPKDTYRFWNPADPGGTLLGMIMERMPSWQVGNVPESLCGRYRTFEVNNENLYNLIKNNIQKAYNCIFEFDTIERVVHVRDVDGAVAEKAVYISHDNLAKEIEVKENTEDIVTRLDVNGAEGVTIRDVNPCGTNRIINLDYYMTPDNFDQELIDKYFAWKQRCEDNRDTYYSLSVQYALRTAEEVSEQAYMADLKGEMTGLENQQAVVIQAIAQRLLAQKDLDAINEEIALKRSAISTQETVLALLSEEKANIFAEIERITKACSFEEYFTADELILLDRYLKDNDVTESSFVVGTVDSYEESGSGSWLDGATVQFTEAAITEIASENTIYNISGGVFAAGDDLSADVINAIVERRGETGFVITAYLGRGSIGGNSFTNACVSVTGDGAFGGGAGATLYFENSTGRRYFTKDASEYEKRSVSWELYQYGNEVLDKLSKPSYTFGVSSANFLAIKDFISFRNEFELGQKVMLDIDDIGILQPVAIGIHFEYDNPESIELQFSNSFVSGDSTFRLIDLLEQSISMGKDVEASKYTYSAFVDSGASTNVKEFMQSALDVAKNALMSSSGQAITWDGAGLRLRTWADDAHTAYEPEQIWMINNSIVMTADGWETAEIAIGKFNDANVGDCWGIVAPRIVGTLLAGNSLVIESAKKDGGVSVFRVDGDGVRLHNGDFNIVGNNKHITLNPTIGFAIGANPVYTIDESGKYVLNEENAKLWIDTDGNIHMKGAVTATSLYIGNQTAAAYVDARALSVTNNSLKSYYAKTEMETVLNDYLKTSEFSSAITQNATSIVSTVTQSTTYKNNLAAKANTSDLNAYLKTSNFASTLAQNSQSIVATVVESGNFYEKQSVVAITSSGIAMSGGSITLNSSSSFSVSSGGTIKINADSSAGSYIYFGNDVSITQNGIAAYSGSFTELTVGGSAVITEATLKYPVIVSASQPSDKNVIWVQPSSVNSKTFRCYTGDSRIYNFGQGINTPKTRNFTLASTSSDALPSGTYKYSLSIPFVLVDPNDQGRVESGLVVSAYAVKNGDTSLQVTFTDSAAFTIYSWGEKTITLSCTSNVNLCADAGEITVYITVATAKTGGFYIQRFKYITLTSSISTTSAGVQACNVFYIT